MTLGDLIKAYREEHNMSMADFAAISGLSKAYVALLEKNMNPKTGKEIAPSIEIIKKVADAIHRDFDDVFNSIDSTTKLIIRPTAASEAFTKSAHKIIKNAIPISEQVTLPVLGKVSAGHGSLAEEEVLFYESADSKYINGEYFYLKVKGDSMSPQIAPDDLVLVKHQTSVDSGDIAVVIVDDMDGMVKKVVYDEKNIHLISFNPYYPEKTFSDADIQRVRIIGKVVESKRKW